MQAPPSEGWPRPRKCHEIRPGPSRPQGTGREGLREASPSFAAAPEGRNPEPQPGRPPRPHQCQLFMLAPSSRSSTTQRGSPWPHFAICAGGAASRRARAAAAGTRAAEVAVRLRRRRFRSPSSELDRSQRPESARNLRSQLGTERPWQSAQGPRHGAAGARGQG